MWAIFGAERRKFTVQYAVGAERGLRRVELRLNVLDIVVCAGINNNRTFDFTTDYTTGSAINAYVIVARPSPGTREASSIHALASCSHVCFLMTSGRSLGLHRMRCWSICCQIGTGSIVELCTKRHPDTQALPLVLGCSFATPRLSSVTAMSTSVSFTGVSRSPSSDSVLLMSIILCGVSSGPCPMSASGNRSCSAHAMPVKEHDLAQMANCEGETAQ